MIKSQRPWPLDHEAGHVKKKYNKSRLENDLHKDNYHNNSLSYSVPAILEATSTLNPGYHVLAIFKTFILLSQLHLSLFKYPPKFLISSLILPLNISLQAVSIFCSCKEFICRLNKISVAIIVRLWVKHKGKQRGHLDETKCARTLKQSEMK